MTPLPPTSHESDSARHASALVTLICHFGDFMVTKTFCGHRYDLARGQRMQHMLQGLLVTW